MIIPDEGVGITMGVNSLKIIAGIDVTDILEFQPSQVITIIAALIVLISAIDKVYSWIANKSDSFFTFRKKKENIESTVELDHTRLDQLEDTMRKESAAMKEILKSQLMERHDIYISRSPAYITKYERALYMTTYQLYSDIDKDPIIDQFYKDILDLPLRD